MTHPVDIPDVPSRILAAATRLFAHQGVAGTPLQEVANAAGITKPTLVYHYGSKDGLREAVLGGLLDHWRAELPRLFAAAASGGPRLDALLGALFDFFRRDPDRARLLVRESLDRPDETAAILRANLQPLTGLLTEAIRVGQRGGALQADAHPEAFTALMVTAALGVVAVGEHAAAFVAPTPSVDVQQQELVRVARAALLSHPHRPKESP